MASQTTKTASANTKPDEKSTALANVAEAPVPDFMRDDSQLGKENIGSQDVVSPRLKLLQGTSPEITEIEGARPGMFYHTTSGTLIEGPLKVVPIYMDRRYILWRPRFDGGGILARSDDGINWDRRNTSFTVKLDKKTEVVWNTGNSVAESGLAEWGSENPDDMDSPPAATLMYSYVFMLVDYPELGPVVVAFQRSGIKAAKKLNGRLKLSRAPIFGHIVQLVVKTETNGEDSFFAMDVMMDGFVRSEQDYKTFKEVHLSFAQSGLSIKDIEGAQNDLPASPSVDDSNDGDAVEIDARTNRVASSATSVTVSSTPTAEVPKSQTAGKLAHRANGHATAHRPRI